MTGVMDDTATPTTTPNAEPEVENGQVIPVEDSNANLLGLESRDITGFILLLIPFTLSWTLGYLGFSSFWTFMITVAVYWATSNQTEYDKRHKRYAVRHIPQSDGLNCFLRVSMLRSGTRSTKEAIQISRDVQPPVRKSNIIISDSKNCLV